MVPADSKGQSDVEFAAGSRHRQSGQYLTDSDDEWEEHSEVELTLRGKFIIPSKF